MTAGRRLVGIWTNPNLSNAKTFELSAYLAVPWLFDLPWSILFHWTLAFGIIRADSLFGFVDGPLSMLLAFAIWYAFTFAPSIMTTIVYLKRDAKVTLGWGIVMGHAFLVMNYLSFVCAWGALYRMLRGRTGWDKTKRVAESRHAHGAGTVEGEG
jgi:hypothetical protein